MESYLTRRFALERFIIIHIIRYNEIQCRPVRARLDGVDGCGGGDSVSLSVYISNGETSQYRAIVLCWSRDRFERVSRVSVVCVLLNLYFVCARTIASGRKHRKRGVGKSRDRRRRVARENAAAAAAGSGGGGGDGGCGGSSGGRLSPGGWLSRARRRRPGHRRRRSRWLAWAPDSGFKKIAENARKRRFQFPENRGKNGNWVEKNRPVRPAGPRRAASVSTCDYCYYYDRRRPTSALSGGPSPGPSARRRRARHARPRPSRSAGTLVQSLAFLQPSVTRRRERRRARRTAAANSPARRATRAGRRSRVGRGFYFFASPPPPLFARHTRRRCSLAITVAHSRAPPRRGRPE